MGRYVNVDGVPTWVENGLVSIRVAADLMERLDAGLERKMLAGDPLPKERDSGDQFDHLAAKVLKRRAV